MFLTNFLKFFHTDFLWSTLGNAASAKSQPRNDKSSCSQMFCKIGVHKNFRNIYKKTLWCVGVSCRPDLCCFPVNSLRTVFFNSTPSEMKQYSKTTFYKSFPSEKLIPIKILAETYLFCFREKFLNLSFKNSPD